MLHESLRATFITYLSSWIGYKQNALCCAVSCVPPIVARITYIQYLRILLSVIALIWSVCLAYLLRHRNR